MATEPKSESRPDSPPRVPTKANDSRSPSGHLSEVLANRRSLGLSNRIPCLTPYVEPLPPSMASEACES